MAVGFGLSLDLSFLSSLEKADNAIDELTKKSNALSRATVSAFQEMSKHGVTPYIEQLQKQKKALEEIGKMKGSSPFLTNMQNEAKKAVDELNNIIKALEKTKAYKGEQSGRSAISFANSVLGKGGEAKSITNMQNAIRQLEEAQNRQNLGTKRGQKNYEKIGETIKKVQAELDKATGKNKLLTQEAEKTAKAAKMVGGNLISAFALNAFRTFTQQLITIRGEFEMQHRSLQILIQDVDKANELWNKTVDLAVKSPYRIKELVTYTKQLAAYRVESEKLYDTTRMLADVSAGLGVDMNRLILAFGQVKAANFLRGTELRQFSEAGVNMLEELAKRFTALEGRAVSVGDVFERVSKRMVTFADVEAVFQTITSEGGTFYKMQEKQAETLKGMMMNLQDSIDLMFNDMGTNQQSVIKRVVKLVKGLVENWRKVGPYIEGAGITLTTFFSIHKLNKIGTAIRGAFATHPYIALAGVILAVGTAIYRAVTASNELASAMNRIDIDVTQQLEDSIETYKRLATQVRDVTLSEKEREKALGKLKSTFDEILPSQMLELEYIKGISDNYAEATDAMKNYYNAKAVEQKKGRVESMFSKETEETDIPELIASIKKRITLSSVFSEEEKVDLRAGVAGVVNSVVDDIKNGKIDNSFISLRDEINNRLSKYSGVDIDVTTKDWLGLQGGFVQEDIQDIISTLDKYRVAIENIQGLPYETGAQKKAAEAILPEKEKMEEAKKIFKELLTLMQQFSQIDVNDWAGKDLEGQIDAIIKKLPETAKEYAPLLWSSVEEMKKVAVKGAFEFGTEMQSLQQTFTLSLADILFGNMQDKMSQTLQDPNTKKSITTFFKELIGLVTNEQEKVEEEVQALDLTDFQKSVNKVFRDVAKDTEGVDVDLFARFIPDSNKTRSEIIKELQALEKQYDDTVKAFKKSISKGVSEQDAEAIHQVTKAQVEQMKKDISALDEAAKRLGEIEKSTKKNKTIDERIKVVDQMNAKYKELNKTLSHEESLKGAFEAYKDAFATAYEREDVRTMTPAQFAKNVLNFPNEDDVIEWLDNLEKEVSDKRDKFKVQMAKGKFEMDVKVRLKKDADKELKNEIEELFDQYNLYLDLKKINIPTDVAKGLFNIDATSIEELRKSLVSRKDEFIGKDMLKEYEEYLKKLDDMEDKAQVDRLKKYLEYTRAAIGERAKIKVDEMNKLLEIEETFKPKELKQEHDIEKAKAEGKSESDIKILEKENEEIRKGNEEIIKRNEFLKEQKALVIANVQEESRQKIQKQEWDEFRSTETFIAMFQDLETASKKSLEYAIQEIKRFRKEWTNMPVSEAKEMIDMLSKLETKLAETGNPWEDFETGKAKLEKAMEDRGINADYGSAESRQQLRDALAEENEGLEASISLSNSIISVLETINNARGEGKKDALELLGITEEYVSSLGLSSSVLTNNEKQNQKLINSEKNRRGLAMQALASNRELTQEEKNQVKRLNEQSAAIGEAQKMANDLYGAFQDLASALGGGDGPAAIFAEMGMNMLNTVLNTLQLQLNLEAAKISATELGIAMNSAMGVIGWIVMAIQLLAQGIAAAVNYADKMRQMKLDVLAGQVENLKKKYDNLAESMENAWSYKQLEDYSRELDKVQKKMEDTQKQYLALLKAGDKNDYIDIAENAQAKLDAGVSVDGLTSKERKALLSEEYQEYKEASDALIDMQEDYMEQKKELIKKLGGITDDEVFDTAEEFVDAWLDAFKETGDGLSGLTENFDEFFQNLLKKKVAILISEKALAGWIEAVNYAIDKDSPGRHDITKEEEETIKKKQKEAEEIANQLLLSIFDGMGFDSAKGGLTALQKGIQGMTEEQAEVLSAYWNSVRGYTASIDSKMDRIIANMTMSAEDNPMLEQLRSQTTILGDIYTLLSSMTTTDTSFSGKAFKTSMK